MPQGKLGESRLKNASQQSTRLRATGWPLRRLFGKLSKSGGERGGLSKILVEFPRFSVFLNYVVRLKVGAVGSCIEGVWVAQRGRIFVHPLLLPSNR